MATTATWTYEITVASDSVYMKKGTSVYATIRRTSPYYVASGRYALYSSNGTVSSDSTVQVYTKSTALTFGSYGTTATLPYQESTHSIANLSVSGIGSGIVNVTPSGQGIYITSSFTGGGNALLLKGTKFTLTVTVYDTFTASSVSVSDNCSFGSNVTVSMSNSNIAYLGHNITFSMGSGYSTTVSVAKNNTSLTWTVPNSWMGACPSGTSATLSISVQTCFDDDNVDVATENIGSPVTKSVTVSVPTTVVPSGGTLTVSLWKDYSGGYATSHNMYIQNLTGVQITASGFSAGTGSSIAYYEISASSDETFEDYSETSNIRQIDRLSGSGSIVFTCKAVDQRGRKSAAVKSSAISVTEYAAPQIISCSAVRCTSNGTASQNGTYASIRIVASVSPISFSGGSNTMTINSTWHYENQTTQYTAQSDMATGVTYIIGGDFSPETKYYVKFTVSDSAGGQTTRDMLIQTAAYSIHIKNGGMGVAFGKTCENEQAVEINQDWSLYYRGIVMPPIVYSASSEPQNPVSGMIWLKKK